MVFLLYFTIQEKFFLDHFVTKVFLMTSILHCVTSHFYCAYQQGVINPKQTDEGTQLRKMNLVSVCSLMLQGV